MLKNIMSFAFPSLGAQGYSRYYDVLLNRIHEDEVVPVGNRYYAYRDGTYYTSRLPTLEVPITFS